MSEMRRNGGNLDLLTVDEVAELLRLTPKGVYAMAAARRIPHVKVSNRLRFVRQEIERWIGVSHVTAVKA